MPRYATRPTLFRRGGAFGLAALVFLLGLLAKLPVAHAWLHTAPEPGRARCEHASAGELDAAPHDDIGCAITLFAQGLPTPDLAPRVAPFQILADASALTEISQSKPRPPARLHPPAHAPPAFG